jgi:VWFA-related protein
MTAFGPTDLVAIMDPLTPSSAIEFTRDRRALADQVHRLEGRSRVYLPPRSAAEEAQLELVNWNAAAVEHFRNQVTATAIKAAAAHLGTLREGRKTLIVVTEGFGVARNGTDFGSGGRGIAPLTPSGIERAVDDHHTAMDIVRTANDTNTAIHVIDPRGLRVAGGVAAMLETLASSSGGEVHAANDIGAAVQRIVSQTSATYLLGYTRERLHDGRFHEIKVKVKRGGYDVRARNGYWAPKIADVERARTEAAAAVLPPAIATAFASLNPAKSSRLVEIWTGSWPLSEKRSLISIAWTPIAAPAGGAEPASVAVQLTAGAEPPVEKVIEPGGTGFEIAGSTAQLAIRVLDKSGDVIDRESRTVETPAAGAALGLAATVHRARNVAETRSLAAADAPIHAGREFARTDRLLIRIRPHGASAPAAAITGRLIDRRGATLLPLTIGGPSEGWHRLDLPLASIAPGDFAIVIEARSGDDRAETVVPLRVRR